MEKAGAVRSKGKWIAIVGLYALIPCVVIFMMRWTAWRDSEGRLRGNIKEATEALAEKCENTPPERRRAMLVSYATDYSPSLRLAAINTFEDEGITDIAPILETAFRDSSSLIRQRALELMYQVEPERGARLLLTGMADEDNEVRRASIAQLNLMATQHPQLVRERAIPILMTGVQDTDHAVSSLSSAALRKLTGKPWRIRGLAKPEERTRLIRQWKTWWAGNEKTWKAEPEYFRIACIVPERIDPAPDFSLNDVEGRPVRLADQKGKITLLNFWGTWWEAAVDEIPILMELDRRYQEKGLDLIGVAIREPDGNEGLRVWCQEHKVTYRQALANADVLDAFCAHELPVTILLDRRNRIRYRWEGGRDRATYEKAIARLLAEGG